MPYRWPSDGKMLYRSGASRDSHFAAVARSGRDLWIGFHSAAEFQYNSISLLQTAATRDSRLFQDGRH
jgi:hypothetical protein